MATTSSSPYAVALYPPLEQSPIFNPQKVSLGITPTGWSNSDDMTIDLNPPTPYQQILTEIALAGFQGTQVCPKFPANLEVLKFELRLRHLRISEPWVGTYFTVGKVEDTIQDFKKQMSFMKEMGGTSIVGAEMGGAVHQRRDLDPLVNRPKFTDEQWQNLIDGLNMLGEMAEREGFHFSYHPHVGTGVEDLADVERLMDNTNPAAVHLLLDTGHLYYAGVDPLVVAQKYAHRVRHVHLKNIRQSILDESKLVGRSFLDSIRAGVFTVPGDETGTIAFKPVLEELAKVNYEGWIMVEAEQDPNHANPLQYALMARAYLRQITGL